MEEPMADTDNLDRRARKDLRRARRLHGQVPDHVRDAAANAAAERRDRKDLRRQRRDDAGSYFFDRDRLARLGPAGAMQPLSATA